MGPPKVESTQNEESPPKAPDILVMNDFEARDILNHNAIGRSLSDHRLSFGEGTRASYLVVMWDENYKSFYRTYYSKDFREWGPNHVPWHNEAKVEWERVLEVMRTEKKFVRPENLRPTDKPFKTEAARREGERRGYGQDALNPPPRPARPRAARPARPPDWARLAVNPLVAPRPARMRVGDIRVLQGEIAANAGQALNMQMINDLYRALREPPAPGPIHDVPVREDVDIAVDNPE